jgi:hypothetical protein
MDKLKEKLNTLRTEADAATTRADNAELELKRVESQLSGRGTIQLWTLFHTHSFLLEEQEEKVISSSFISCSSSS